MEQRIATIGEKKLVGKRLKMSLTDNKTDELWRSFMVQRKEITNAVGTLLYSLQILPPDYYTRFNPAAEFEKWAAAEVENFENIAPGMETFVLPAGLYAVFIHKGGPEKGAQAFQYIMGTWLPASGYILDNRPQFEVLGEKYKNNDPDSEEEIWIPIAPKP